MFYRECLSASQWLVAVSTDGLLFARLIRMVVVSPNAFGRDRVAEVARSDPTFMITAPSNPSRMISCSSIGCQP